VGALVSPLDCFPVLSQVVAKWVPPWYDVSRSDPTLPSLAGKHTAGSCGLSTKKMIHVSWDAGARVSLGARKSTHFCLEDRWRARTNSIIDPACRLLPSLVQVLPVVGPPSCAMLVVCRGDQQRTVAHRRPFPAPTDSAQGRGKEGLMGLWGPHASASSLAARTASSLCQSNKTCPVTLLAVHAASGHEAGGDGSFHERPHRRLPLDGAVPSAPPQAAPPSATRKREDRLPAALALATAA